MDFLKQKIKELLPAYFALVMATGIISLAAYFNGFERFGYFLFYLNLIFLSVLVFSYIYRCLFYWRHVLVDFESYKKGPGFFTIVAALCIVGNQFVILYQHFLIAKVLLVIAAVIWFVIGYGFFLNITVTEKKESLKNGISGTWLVFIVSIQALSTLTSILMEDFGTQAYVLLFLSLCLFLLGCIFYLYIMSLIIYRISFFSLHAGELGAPYWINMGATAITTLAGSMLILNTQQANFIIDILPFLKGFTLFFWVAGTWWIPLLILLGFWRHAIKKVPAPLSPKGYDPSYWGMVFPLGMYTVCTFRLSEALQISFLKFIPQFFVFIAIFAWIVVIIGFLRHLLSLFKVK